MAYVISDACISCGACESECPVSCISEGDTQYVIDAGSFNIKVKKVLGEALFLLC